MTELKELKEKLSKYVCTYKANYKNDIGYVLTITTPSEVHTKKYESNVFEMMGLSCPHDGSGSYRLAEWIENIAKNLGYVYYYLEVCEPYLVSKYKDDKEALEIMGKLFKCLNQVKTSFQLCDFIRNNDTLVDHMDLISYYMMKEKKVTVLE